MNILTILLVAGLGLIFGSFVNALVWRMHAQEVVKDQIDVLRADKERTKRSGEKLHELNTRLSGLSMSKGRSMCSKCHHPLAPKDLIPLFSWVLLRGKCRYCRKPIEDTPLLEAGLPVVFVLSYVFWPLDVANLAGYGFASFVLWLVFLVGFAALSTYDIRWFLLPDKIVWPLAVLALAQVLVHATVFDGGMHTIINAFWGVVVCSGIFYALFTISKGEWIGGGDVKLGIVLGLLTGGPLQGLLLIFVASLLGTAVSLPMLLQKKLHRTSIIPFGPFLMLACVIIVLFGQRLSDWFSVLLLIPV
jgi:prepilin signal peptidase PulO-like enzyme (type II secretory pathway)